MKLYIVNATSDSTIFDAQDSQIYLYLQAKNPKGEWQNIEHLSASWCGNSYHNARLAPNEYWDFVIPRYEGSFKTMLRAKLVMRNTTEEYDEQVIYGNEFAGSVNLTQFWRVPNYYTYRIMENYFD